MPDSAPVIVWFRQDLRLRDNPALTDAAGLGRPVIPLYILDETADVRRPGAASRWWLDKSLRALGKDIEALGGRLILRRGPAARILAELVAETGAEAVRWSRLYDAASVARDVAIKAKLAKAGVECRSFNAALLNEPWEVKTGAGGDYRVFTPYWRTARAPAGDRAPTGRPGKLRAPAGNTGSDPLASWSLHPTAPDWSKGFEDWAPGEAGAQRRLDGFLDDVACRYATGRDKPAVAGTSQLSPHLHFGEIGPRQIWAAVQGAAVRQQASHPQVETFLEELGWREFNHHVFYHHPNLTGQNLDSAFDAFPWREDAEGLMAWRRGRTGFPIVDAGMRQLWATGWMHNRVRMIAASFLVKDLMIDWRIGEAWFWDTLVDADLANNVLNWQWVAGSGADAAPYFRVFNPTLQGRTFDPDGDYVRRWVPELAGLPGSVIHEPWRVPPEALAKAGVEPGVDYPIPIIDHVSARKRALAAYRGLRS
ncbi:MAG: deoxyribodipyrimidine photo-lyase [Caulobacteraceae bacterium]|nr:deoxyribodipyrimidine photo-lyase [Caulobacteraceae bacterium]